MQRASAGRARAVFSLLAAMSLILASAAPLAAAAGWSLSASPTAIEAGASTVMALRLTDTDGSGDIGCMRMTIPSGFAVSDVAVTATNALSPWVATTSGSGPTAIQVLNSDGNGKMKAGDWIDFYVAVVADAPGTYVWSADVVQSNDCTGTTFLAPISVPIEVTAPAPTATPTPISTPIPAPPQEPTPAPPVDPGPSVEPISPSAAPVPPPPPSSPGAAPAGAPTLTPAPSPASHAGTAAPGRESPSPTGTPTPTPAPEIGGTALSVGSGGESTPASVAPPPSSPGQITAELDMPAAAAVPLGVVRSFVGGAVEQVALVVKPDAAVAVATSFTFPLLLAIAVIVYLVVQGHLDSRDPKLRLAPRTPVDAVVPFRSEDEL